MESCIARPLLICANLLKITHITKRSTKMYARLRCGGNLLQCLAFGTGEGHLWYGICVPCSKRLPGVRDASSEAFGVKNRLLRYGRDIRCKKQAPVVPNGFSKALGAQNSLLWYGCLREMTPLAKAPKTAPKKPSEAASRKPPKTASEKPPKAASEKPSGKPSLYAKSRI